MSLVYLTHLNALMTVLLFYQTSL